MPIDWMNGSGSSTRPASPTATVSPEKTTACPAYSMVGTSAASVSSRDTATRRGSPSIPSRSTFCCCTRSSSSRKR